MSRGGFERPPLWAVVAMVVSAVAFVVLAVVASNRPAPPGWTAPSVAGAGSSPSEAPSPPSSVTIPATPRLLVLGDSYTEGNGANSSQTTFARIAARELGWPVETFGEGGTGFTNGGPQGDRSYIERVEALDPAVEPSVIVVQGGLNDRGNRGITGSAVAAVEALQERWPDAVVILMGPVNPNPPDPRAGQVAEQLRAAAAEVQVPFIDASGWITEENVDQYGRGDGLHVNQAGHTYLGQQLADAIRGLAA